MLLCLAIAVTVAEASVLGKQDNGPILSSSIPAKPLWWPRDTDWPPIPEPWRCLNRAAGSPYYFEDELYDAFVTLNGGERADCPLVTDDICQGAQFYPVPCNCHAFVECEPFDNDAGVRACIKKCDPYDLIYDPNTQVRRKKKHWME